MRGLRILVAGPDPARFRSALELASTQAALGARTRLFLQAAAVPLAAISCPDDARHAAAGLPTRIELIDASLVLGARILLCQSGLALAGLGMAAFDPRLEAGGLTALLSGLGEDRLVAF